MDNGSRRTIPSLKQVVDNGRRHTSSLFILRPFPSYLEAFYYLSSSLSLFILKPFTISLEALHYLSWRLALCSLMPFIIYLQALYYLSWSLALFVLKPCAIYLEAFLFDLQAFYYLYWRLTFFCHFKSVFGCRTALRNALGSYLNHAGAKVLDQF